MRTVLTLALFLSLCAAANAAKLHDGKPPHAAVYPGQTPEPRFNRPRQSPNPNDPPVLMDQTPSYNDPSKYGGA
jgi:hypothetical protein